MIEKLLSGDYWQPTFVGMDPDLFRRRAWSARIKAGLDQETLARQMNVLVRDASERLGFKSRKVNRTLVGQIERGDVIPLPVELEMWARACEVPAQWLTDEDFDPFTAQASDGSDAGEAALDLVQTMAAQVEAIYTLLVQDTTRKGLDELEAGLRENPPRGQGHGKRSA